MSENQKSLEEIGLEIPSSSPKTRITALHEIKKKEDWDASEYEYIANILFDTLFLYADRSSCGEVESCIETLSSRSKDFSSQLLKRMLKISDSLCQTKNFPPPSETSFHRPRMTLFNWFCRLLKNEVPSSFRMIVSHQAILLSYLVYSNRFTQIHCAFRNFQDLLNKKKEYFEEYVKVLSDIEFTIFHSILLSQLVEYAKKNSLLEPHISKFTEWFSKSMFSGTTKPEKPLYTHTKAIIQSIKPSDWTSVTLPSFNRSIKRVPELILDFSCYLFRHITVDINKNAQEVIGQLIPYIRSQTVSIRNDALELLKEIIAKITDPTVVTTVLQDFVKLIKDKLPYPYERSGVILALSTFFRSQRRHSQTKIGKFNSPSLVYSC